MAITVNFGTDTKKRNSTKIPSVGDGVACVLKEGTSVESPTFILQNVTPWAWNVAYCADFGRYYFVDNVRYYHSTYEVSCSCDYLASYRDEILGNTLFVARSASVRDDGLTDLKFPLQAQPVITVTTGAIPTSTSGTIIICTAGKGGNAFHAVSPSTFKALCEYLYSDDYLNGLNSILETPSDVQKEIAHPEEYLLSAIWIPFALSTVPSESISLGYINTGLSGRSVGTGQITSFTLTLAIPKHPTSENYPYRNTEPFSYYDLSLPYIGSTRLSARDLNGKASVNAIYRIDINGAIACDVYADSLHLFTASGNCGSPVGFSSRSTNVIGTLQSTIGAVADLATANLAGFANGIISAAQNVSPHVQSSGGSGGTMAENNNGYLKGTFFTTTTIDNQRFGLPYCRPISLGSLSGYAICENASVSCSATDAGKATINNFLNGGLFIE